MKKIGFVDYCMDEWHANNYPAWIEEANKTLGTDYRVAYAWAEKELCRGTAAWCERFGAEPCATVEELCEKSDVIFILAPSNPETHLEYARRVFPCGKRVYVDKTFAPNYREAEEIFALAKQYGTPFFSTSALRYASELDEISDVRHLIITGGGGNLEEYIIHQAEMAVKLTGIHSASVNVSAQGDQRIISVKGEGRDGKPVDITFLYAPAMSFSVCAETADGSSKYRAIKSGYFLLLLTDILRFFESGKQPFDPTETLAVMSLRDAILAADKN